MDNALLAGHQVTWNHKSQNDIDDPADNGSAGIIDHRNDVSHHCLDGTDCIREGIIDRINDICKVNIRIALIQRIQTVHDGVIQRGRLHDQLHNTFNNLGNHKSQNKGNKADDNDISQQERKKFM